MRNQCAKTRNPLIKKKKERKKTNREQELFQQMRSLLTEIDQINPKRCNMPTNAEWIAMLTDAWGRTLPVKNIANARGFLLFLPILMFFKTVSYVTKIKQTITFLFPTEVPLHSIGGGWIMFLPHLSSLFFRVV